MGDELHSGVEFNDLVVSNANGTVICLAVQDVTEFDLHAGCNGVFLDLEPGPDAMGLTEVNSIDLDIVVGDLGCDWFKHVRSSGWSG